jgi:hypothetical protein
VTITGTWPNQTISVQGNHGGEAGTVTSVGLSLPSLFTVTGSPVTTAGTLTATLVAQPANLVWAGPATGTAAAPAFRSLVASDIPTIPAGQVLGLATVATSGAYGDLSGRPTLGTLAAQNGTFSGTSSGTNTGDQDLSGLAVRANNLSDLANAATARSNLGAAGSGAIGSSGLTMATNLLLGRSTAGTGPVEDLALGGGLLIQGGSLLLREGIALVCSETGETVTARLNHKEKAVDRACTVVAVTWELAPTAPSTSGSSQAMLYARRSGTKTSLLTANASLPVTTGIFTDVSGTLTGTLTLAAGDTLGVDLNQVGTGASGLILTAYVRYS